MRFSKQIRLYQSPEGGDAGSGGGGGGGGSTGNSGGFFSNLFGGGHSVPSAPATPTAPAQGGKAEAPTSPAPKPTSPTQEDSLDPSTLDGFAKILLKSQQSTNGSPSSTSETLDLTQLASQPEAFRNLADRFDFTADLPEDVVKGIGEGDAKALMSAVGFATKAAYAQALQHAAMLSGRSSASAQPSIERTVQQQVQQLLNQHALQNAIPKDGHPATNLVINSVAQGLMQSVPGMDPENAVSAARQLIRDMGSSLDPKPKGAPNGNRAWDDWMST